MTNLLHIISFVSQTRSKGRPNRQLKYYLNTLIQIKVDNIKPTLQWFYWKCGPANSV